MNSYGNGDNDEENIDFVDKPKNNEFYELIVSQSGNEYEQLKDLRELCIKELKIWENNKKEEIRKIEEDKKRKERRKNNIDEKQREMEML